MVLHDGCSRNPREQSLLHSTLKPENDHLRRGLITKNKRDAPTRYDKAYDFNVYLNFPDGQPRYYDAVGVAQLVNNVMIKALD